MFKFIKNKIEAAKARRAAEEAAWEAEEAARENAERIAREEEKAREEKVKLDNFYGCTEDGRVTGAFIFMDMQSIGVEYKEVEKKYILCDIEKLRKLTIMRLLTAWMGTGKAEWEFMMAYSVMYPLRKSWKEGKNTADITRLFQMELIALPTGDPREKLVEMEGRTFRVFDQEDIRNKVLKFFDITKTDYENIYLTLRVDD